MDSWAQHIRVARLTDAADLATLCGQLGYPSGEGQVRDRLCLLDDPERTLLVAAPAHGLAGYIDVHVQRTIEEDAYAEVGGLVVAAEHRGSGAGAALLEAAAAWSRERGLAHLWIRANLARGAAAHGFYVRVGCRTVKDQRVYEYPL
jgi:GNAT superfamily N-acetyltransferase